MVITSSSLKDRKSAKELGISTGRYCEIQEIGQADAQTGTQEQSASMSDIVEQYRDVPIGEVLVRSGKIEKESFADQPQREEGGGQPEEGEPEDRAEGGQETEDRQQKTDDGFQPDPGSVPQGMTEEKMQGGEIQGSFQEPPAGAGAGSMPGDENQMRAGRP